MVQSDSTLLPQKKYAKPDDATLRRTLTAEQYAVTPSDPLPMSMTTSSERAYTLMLQRANRSSPPQISMIQVVDGLLFQSQ